MRSHQEILRYKMGHSYSSLGRPHPTHASLPLKYYEGRAHLFPRINIQKNKPPKKEVDYSAMLYSDIERLLEIAKEKDLASTIKTDGVTKSISLDFNSNPQTSVRRKSRRVKPIQNKNVEISSSELDQSSPNADLNRVRRVLMKKKSRSYSPSKEIKRPSLSITNKRKLVVEDSPAGRLKASLTPSLFIGYSSTSKETPDMVSSFKIQRPRQVKVKGYKVSTCKISRSVATDKGGSQSTISEIEGCWKSNNDAARAIIIKKKLKELETS